MVWSLYWLAFWPAIMSYDSLDQWSQVVSGRFSDLHPAFHTMLMWLITRVDENPAWVALCQILLLSAVAGWGFALAREMGVSRPVVLSACLLFVLLPWSGAWAIVIWKDIPYGIVILALTLTVLQIVRADGRWFLGRWAWVKMGFLLSLAALMRHNGFAVTIGLPLVLMVVFLRYWRKCAAALGLALGLWMLVHGPLYKGLRVQTLASDQGRQLMFYPLVAQVAAHLSAGTPLTPSEEKYLDDLHPSKKQWAYDGIDLNVHRFNQFDKEVINKDPTTFLRISFSLFLRRPLVTIVHWIRHSVTIWKPYQSYNGENFNIGLGINELGQAAYIVPGDNEMGIVTGTVLPGLSIILAKFILWSQKGPLNAWLPAYYLYLLIILTAWRASRSHNPRIWLLIGPVVLHTMLLFFLIPARDSRYQFPVFLVAAVLWPALLFGKFSSRKGAEDMIRENGNPV